MVKRSLIDTCSLTKFCRIFWIDPTLRSPGVSSSTAFGWVFERLSKSLWTSCLPCEDYVGRPITFDAYVSMTSAIET